MAFLLEPLPLPASTDLETPAVLRQLARTRRHLAELKGAAATIPNEAILCVTPTAMKYLDALHAGNFVRKTKPGRTNFYINERLFALLSRQ